MELWWNGGPLSRSPFSELVTPDVGSDVEALEVGFAYASLAGADALRAAIETSPALRTAPKRVYLGIHHGITEPKAIKILGDMQKTRVYIVSPTKNISLSALINRPIFHPKYCALLCKSGADRWVVGSGNLTRAAMRPGGNFEIAAVSRISGNQKTAARDSLKTWNATFRELLIEALPARVSQYENVRLRFLRDNPIFLDRADASDDISMAHSLFVEVGAGSGMDRHQIEFNNRLASFFGPLAPSRRDLILRKGNRVWDGRPLTPKRTTFGVEIYRLGMPTVRNDGVPISERAIRFRRTSDVNKFDFDVADVGGRKYSGWVKECNAQGHLGNTSGGRVYGYLM